MHFLWLLPSPIYFGLFFAEGALSSAYVPILAEKYAKDKNNTIKYLNQLIIEVSGIILFVTLLVYIFPDYIVTLFMPGSRNDLEVVGIASKMLVIVMPYLWFVTVVAMLTGYLNLMGSYYIPYSSTAMLNIFMMLGALAGYYYGGNIIYLAWGVFWGGVAQLFYVFFYSLKKRV